MKHTKGRYMSPLALLLAAALAMGMLSGCNTKDEELVTVKLSEVTHSVFYAPQYVAIELGFFEEEGLAIKLISGEGADKVMTSVISGSVDIGFSGPEAAIYIYNEGRSDHAVVFAQVTQRDGSFLMAREPDDNFTWEKLRGPTCCPAARGACLT